LNHMATTGTNFVAIVVTQYQLTHTSTKIFPLYEPLFGPYFTYVTPTDEELLVSINYAHQLGMKVMLKPHIDLTEDDKYWRGDIGKGFNDSQWDLWFESYGEMLLKYAKFSEEHGVEEFSLSCELIEASKAERQWRELIKKVRKVYHGDLTAAANWGWLNATGGEETNKTWWDAVDFIGVDAYYANHYLQNVTHPTEEIIVEFWQPVVARLANLSRVFNRPVLITEVGYCAGRNSCARTSPPPTKEELQYMALYYKAFFEVMLKQEWFVGAFWWNWTTDAAFGGETNVCMTPSYKPAELVLRQYYEATEPIPPKPTYPPLCLCTL